MNRYFCAFLFLFANVANAAEDLPNFAQVSARIYRGGRPTPQGLRTLKQMGVKTLLDLQGGDVNFPDPAVNAFLNWWEPGETAENIAKEKELAENSLYIRFVSAPLSSISPVTPAEDAQIDQILEIMADPSAQPVYVHCAYGIDRTGLIIALYEVKVFGLSAEEAHAHWAASGHEGMRRFFTGNLDDYFYKKAEHLGSVHAAGAASVIGE